MLGVKPIPLQTYPEDGFVPSLERCTNLITPKTKAIALVTPNNPVSHHATSLIAPQPHSINISWTDRRDLFRLHPRLVCPSSHRERYSSHHRRNLPRLHNHRRTTLPLLPELLRSTSRLVMALPHNPPLLVLQVLLHPRPPSRRTRRFTCLTATRSYGAGLFADMSLAGPAVGACAFITKYEKFC